MIKLLKISLVFLLSIILILYTNMSLENWGGMTKAQDNSQTIDEAIAFAIAEHEADPESHMGAGESIENHRVNDIIDHPQGSVVSDKTSVNQLQMATNFEDVSGWYTVAQTTFNEFGNFYLGTNSTVGNAAYSTLEDGVPILCNQFHKNVLAQIVFSISTGAVGLYKINLSLLGDIDFYLGLGFEIDNLTLKGVFNDGDTVQKKTLLTIERNRTYVARAFANQATQKIEFWVDGTLIDSYDFAQEYTSDETLAPYFHAEKVSGTGTVALTLHQFFISRDI